MKVSLLFGSFNPIHYGHIALAECILFRDYADEVWFVVSPQNPLKEDGGTDKDERAHKAELEVSKNSFKHRIKVSRIEFDMAVPSYSIDTLTRLKNEFPQIEFSLVMGEDNLRAFHKWRDYEEIANMVKIYVYPREGNDYKNISEMAPDVKELKNIEYIKDVELLNISSTTIREAEKYLKRGIKHQQSGNLDKALNDFIVAQELIPDNKEINSRVEMIKSIFDYSYKQHINV